jgi:hypothetical protein
VKTTANQPTRWSRIPFAYTRSVKKLSPFTDPDGTLPYSQQHVTAPNLSLINPTHILDPTTLRSHFILSLHLRPRFRFYNNNSVNCRLQSGFAVSSCNQHIQTLSRTLETPKSCSVKKESFTVRKSMSTFLCLDRSKESIEVRSTV